MAGRAAGHPQHSVPGKRQLDLLLALATLCLQTRVLWGLADGQEWPGDTSWAQAVLGKAGSDGAGVGMHHDALLDQGAWLILPVLLTIHR